AEVAQHKQLGRELQKLDHMAAQCLIRICFSYEDRKRCAHLVDDVMTLSDSMNLLMTGCEYIVADGLRQQPTQVIIHIHRRRDVPEERSKVNEEGIALEPNCTLLLQVSSVRLLISWVMCLVSAAKASPGCSMPLLKALRKLMNALVRQQGHFAKIGAAQTMVSVVVDDEASSSSACS
ncbi:MAG TPA: hypothetical protein VFI95_21955, partial [Terriglobales bacterium]|nr:hypothetical protein [Terriglobales bacterium]